MGAHAVTPQCGHPHRRHVARLMCRSCYNTWHLRTHAHSRLRQNRQRAAHRRQHINRLRPKELVYEARRTYETRRVMTLRRHGLTPETYTQVSLHQEGVCAICRQAPSKEPLHVDHCHTTGVVRGLLCRRCNTHISSVELPNWLVAAHHYLANYPAVAAGVNVVCNRKRHKL